MPSFIQKVGMGFPSAMQAAGNVINMMQATEKWKQQKELNQLQIEQAKLQAKKAEELDKKLNAVYVLDEAGMGLAEPALIPFLTNNPAATKTFLTTLRRNIGAEEATGYQIRAVFESLLKDPKTLSDIIIASEKTARTQAYNTALQEYQTLVSSGEDPNSKKVLDLKAKLNNLSNLLTEITDKETKWQETQDSLTKLKEEQEVLNKYNLKAKEAEGKLPLTTAQQVAASQRQQEIDAAKQNVSWQRKTKVYVDPTTNKTMVQYYDYNPKTRQEEPAGTPFEKPANWTITGYDTEGNAIMTSMGGAPSQVTVPTGLPRSEVEGIKNQEIAAQSAISAIGQIRSLVDEGGGASVIGIVGKAQRFIDSASEQLMALAGAVSEGREVEDKSLLSPETYDFRGLAQGASTSAEIKSLFVKLAYSIARAQDPAGRLSKEDVQYALDQVGGATGSPTQLMSVLNLLENNLKLEFSRMYLIKTGKEYTGFGTSPQTPQAKSTQELYDQYRNQGLSPEEAIKRIQ